MRCFSSLSYRLLRQLSKKNSGDSCQAPHTQYIVSGRIKVVMDDGAEEEFGPGDAALIPPGHNAWVVGNEPIVGIDFTGLKEYAKS